MAARRSDFDIPLQRLRNQALLASPFATPEAAVAWLGAVQAQDYAGAKWAVGQRTQACTDADVERAYDEGRLLRTHVLRPTWHFVVPEDIRFLLQLTAPRVLLASARRLRELELDAKTVGRSQALFRKFLCGRYATRRELSEALARARIAPDGQRLAYLLMHAELDGVICSGPRRGKQFTYALLDERVPAAPSLSRDEALARLALRYLRSHGPAQARDFAWWSGLTQRAAQSGIDAHGDRIAALRRADKTYYYAPDTPVRARKPLLHLLPNYDEQLIGYRDRTDCYEPGALASTSLFSTRSAPHFLAVDGRVIGHYRREPVRAGVLLIAQPGRPLSHAEQGALASAARAYAKFLDIPVEWRMAN